MIDDFFDIPEDEDLADDIRQLAEALEAAEPVVDAAYNGEVPPDQDVVAAYELVKGEAENARTLVDIVSGEY